MCTIVGLERRGGRFCLFELVECVNTTILSSDAGCFSLSHIVTSNLFLSLVAVRSRVFLSELSDVDGWAWKEGQWISFQLSLPGILEQRVMRTHRPLTCMDEY